MSDQIIGSLWRRKRDGVIVRVTGWDANWDDVHWKSVDDTKRKGVIWWGNWKNKYEPADQPDQADTKPSPTAIQRAREALYYATGHYHSIEAIERALTAALEASATQGGGRR